MSVHESFEYMVAPVKTTHPSWKSGFQYTTTKLSWSSIKKMKYVFLNMIPYGYAQAFSPQHWLHLVAVLVMTTLGILLSMQMPP